MIGDEVVQATIISKLKSIAPFTSSFGSVQNTEIREWDWQGDTFTYPNIRVELEDNKPYYDEQQRCTLQNVEFSVYIFSEQKSSKECSQIKTNIINSFTTISNQSLGVASTVARIVESVPVIRQDEATWRAQIKYSCKISAWM